MFSIRIINKLLYVICTWLICTYYTGIFVAYTFPSASTVLTKLVKNFIIIQTEDLMWTQYLIKDSLLGYTQGYNTFSGYSHLAVECMSLIKREKN